MEKPHIPFTSSELVEMLSSTDPEERAASARRIWTDWDHLENREILIELGSKLIELLKKEGASRHSWHYMMALGSIRHIEAIPELIEKLENSPSENIRGFAADALSKYTMGQLDENTIELLWMLAENDDSLVVRVNSIRALANPYIGSKDDVISNKLLKLLKTQNHSAISSTIIGLLGEIGCLKIVPELTHIMIARRTKSVKTIASTALDKIAKIHGFNNRSDLLKRIENIDSVAVD